MSRLWWLKHWDYFVYVVRDLTPGPVLIWLVIFLVELRRLDGGAANYRPFTSPWFVLFSGLCLAAALFHSITWINLTGRVLPSRIGQLSIRPSTFSAAFYVAWLLATGIVGTLLVWLAR